MYRPHSEVPADYNTDPTPVAVDPPSIFSDLLIPLVPPLNFAMVAPGVYRSGYPNKQNFPFLRKLKLRTVMYLAAQDYTPEMKQFVEEEGIQFFHYRVDGNKEPFVEINQTDIANALVKLLDRRNHPVLIHCDKGKHRIGVLVGCLRKLQNWSMTSIFDEYRRFGGSKVLPDQEFIEIFDEPVPYDSNYKPFWL
ncbi:uncharacterized protein VTP21DRAFT_11211 [Calcarisporiella thermophila]|uniref:uncharacterized protein n=1 Tax=Calcarisporiella thermophila TaxID=911321 RepID=UPI003742B5D0